MPSPVEEIATLLREKYPSAFCPGCVASGVFGELEAVTLACVEVGLSAGFQLRLGECSWCGRRDFLVSAAAAESDRQP